MVLNISKNKLKQKNQIQVLIVRVYKRVSFSDLSFKISLNPNFV